MLVIQCLRSASPGPQHDVALATLPAELQSALKGLWRRPIPNPNLFVKSNQFICPVKCLLHSSMSAEKRKVRFHHEQLHERGLECWHLEHARTAWHGQAASCHLLVQFHRKSMISPVD